MSSDILFQIERAFNYKIRNRSAATAFSVNEKCAHTFRILKLKSTFINFLKFSNKRDRKCFLFMLIFIFLIFYNTTGKL